MAYKLATAYVDIHARTSKFNAQLGGVKASLGSLAAQKATGAITAFTAAVGAAAAVSLRFIAAAEKAVETEMRLRLVLRASGEQAGFNATEILKMVEALKQTTKFSGGELQGAATNLLKFDKVTGNTFKRAMTAATDLAQVGFGSVETAAQALGRALQDPARGVRALRSAGIILDKQQTKSLENMIKQGQIAKAQGLILDMVAEKAGGAAAAFAKTPFGQWAQLKNQISDIAEELGIRLLPMALAIGKAILWAANQFISFIDWTAVIIANWDITQRALLHGFDFLGSAALDILLHAFTAPFKVLMDVGAQAFGALPRLFEAAMTGGMEGLGAQIAKEFGEAVSKSMKTMTDFKFSPDTRRAAKAFDNEFAKLKKKKEELEEGLRKWAGLKDMAPAKVNLDAKGMIEHQIEFPSGLTGITDAWRNLQEAILKAEKDDPMERAADGIANLEDVQGNMLDEIVKLNTDGVKLQGVAVA